MCCHNKIDVIPPLCVPIQCGAVLNKHIDGCIPDCSGDNISSQNHEYCELTAHYYAWKNETADYYGFCHYRRFFCYNDSLKYPYIMSGRLTSKHIPLLGSEQEIQRLCNDYDIIIPRSEDMGITVREHYCSSAHHFADDLSLFLEILYRMFPQLIPFADRYLS